MSKTTKEQLVLSGTFFWAHLAKPSELSPDKFSLNLSVDKKTKALLEAKGIKLRKEGDGKGENSKKHVGTENDRGDYVNLTRSVKLPDGTILKPVEIVDAKKNPLSGEVLIGNGSTGKVVATLFHYKHKTTKEKLVGLNLDVVQVLSLVKFNSKKASDLLEEEVGFESDVLDSGKSLLDDDMSL